MRLKAAANQVDVELSSTKAQIDRIQRKIQSIEDSTDTLNMEKTIRNLVKDFVSYSNSVNFHCHLRACYI